MKIIHRLLKNYGQTHRSPKRLLSGEAVMFHICSGFCTLIAYVVFHLMDVDVWFASGIACLIGMAVYSGLFRLNNCLCLRDERYIEQFMLTHRVDCLDLLNAFFRDIQAVFRQKGIQYSGSEIPEATRVDIDMLFITIFREDGVLLANRFRSDSGAFYRFVSTLSLQHREVLYRFYLDDQALMGLAASRPAAAP